MNPAADPLVLASGSPQRRAILEQLGVEFEAVSSRVEEEARGEPRQVVVENALAQTVLVKLHKLRKVEIDRGRRVARVGAGTIWIEAVEAAAEHGLAALAGSSPDVGIAASHVAF